MARCGDSNITDQIKRCFRRFDEDGNGMISKCELREVLKRLCRKNPILTESEINTCMAEADKNGNGVIEYDEFVDWLLKPGSRIQSTSEGPRIFDLDAVLTPLFNVFDKNGDGTVTVEEFNECHCILQNAVKLSRHKEGSTTKPKMLDMCSNEVFQQLDKDRDSHVSFGEFVEWQRKAFEKSGLLSEDLKDLVPALARQLQRIFKFSEVEERGALTDEDQNLLHKVIDNVADFACDIWNENRAGHSSLHGKFHYTNRWSEPPPGLNIQRLTCQHLMLNPMSVSDLHNVLLEIVCVPELLEKVPEHANRRWFARVRHRLEFKEPAEQPCYYLFKQLSWEQVDDSADFEESFAAFPPELRFYLILKTEANFGVEIRWDAMENAMRTSVDSGLVTTENLHHFNVHMEAQVFEAARVQGYFHGSPSEAERSHILAMARANTMLSCRNIMSTLTEMRLFNCSTKLADCLDA